MTIDLNEWNAERVDKLDDISVRHLRYFLLVVEAGSISGAADVINVAQPSLSQQIRKLEQRIGFSLFTRTKDGVELTGQGEMFHRSVAGICQNLLAAVAEARRERPAIRIGLCAGVPAELLTTIADTFAAVGASVQVTYRPANSSEQTKLLGSDRLEFGLVRLPVTGRDLVRAMVSDEELGIVTGIQHPLAVRDTLSWRDLAGQRLLWFDTRRAPGYATYLLAEMESTGWHPVLHVMPSDRHALFVHALSAADDLVALRPRNGVAADSQIVWHRIAEPQVPREQLALLAVPRTDQASTLAEMASLKGWDIGPVPGDGDTSDG